MLVTTRLICTILWGGANATILPISERWKLRPTEVKYITQIQKRMHEMQAD